MNDAFRHMQPSDILNQFMRFGTAMIAGAAVIRFTGMAIDFSWFDVDPAFVDHEATGLLPSTRFLLDALMFVGAGLIFLLSATLKQTISWWLVILALLPVPVVFWHAWYDPADLEQGSMWMASILGAVALSHAARDRLARGLGLAILMAGLVFLMIRAIEQVIWDIPSTIAYFESNREEVLAMRGLEPGSSAALVLERRLLNAVPTAWFDSTNLLSSLMAAGSCFWLCISIHAFKSRLTSGVSGLCGFMAVCLAAIVLATGSIGGLAVLLVGVLFIIAYQLRPSSGRAFGWMAVSLVVLALMAAPLSSLLGELPGINSLLIRSGYVAGAAEITSSAPLVGVGPAGFQDAWMLVRGPSSPEEIVSPHSMPWDWLATTGALSLSWISLILLGLWWSFRRVDQGIGEEITGRQIAAMLMFIVAIWFPLIFSTLLVDLVEGKELSMFGSGVLALRIIGWLCFIGLVLFLMWLWKRIPMGLTIGAAMAALVVVIHAQVEMTIQQTNTSPWIVCLIGLVAPASSRFNGLASRWLTGLVSCLLAISLATIVITIGYSRSIYSEGLIDFHGRAVHDSSLTENGGTVLTTRTVTAQMLMETARAFHDDRLQLIAAEQLLAGIPMSLSMPSPPTSESVETVRQLVINISMDSFERTGSVEAGHLALSALLSRGTSEDLDQALIVATAVADRDPSGIWSQRHLADVLWESGDRAQARSVYQRVLQLDAARSIDPLRQLNQQDREFIQLRAATQIID